MPVRPGAAGGDTVKAEAGRFYKGKFYMAE
jgi:hypothetical protein